MATVADTLIAFSGFERKDFSVFVSVVDSAQHAKALARRDSSIGDPQDLIGKKVATTIGTSAHLYRENSRRK